MKIKSKDQKIISWYSKPSIFWLQYAYLSNHCGICTRLYMHCSSTLAWKIPWMEEPDRLPPMGLLRVGHDWVTSLSLFTFTFHFHALKKEMATHSSVLAWRIPGTREPGGLMSKGSHRVGHDWSDLAAYMHCTFSVIGGFLHFLRPECHSSHPHLQDMLIYSQIIFPLEYFSRFLVRMPVPPFPCHQISNSILFQLHAFLLHFSGSPNHRVWLLWYSPYIIVSCVLSCSVMSNSLLTHRLQPSMFLCPWDFPGKNTGVRCYFLL